MKLYKGNVVIVGRKSAFSLYDDRIASFEDDQGAYDQKDAAGFIKLQVGTGVLVSCWFSCGFLLAHHVVFRVCYMQKYWQVLTSTCMYLALGLRHHHHHCTGAAFAHAGHQPRSSQGQWRPSKQAPSGMIALLPNHCVHGAR